VDFVVDGMTLGQDFKFFSFSFLLFPVVSNLGAYDVNSVRIFFFTTDVELSWNKAKNKEVQVTL
jgi:hypothetical protein